LLIYSPNLITGFSSFFAPQIGGSPITLQFENIDISQCSLPSSSEMKIREKEKKQNKEEEGFRHQMGHSMLPRFIGILSPTRVHNAIP
ncbi:hypothetical protein HAX54_004623, partial [Datura stramonium]|nr:hypothetical protein [Datura stramonium]